MSGELTLRSAGLWCPFEPGALAVGVREDEQALQKMHT